MARRSRFGQVTRRISFPAPAGPGLDDPVQCRTYIIRNPVGGVHRRVVYVGECVDTSTRCPRDRWEEHLERAPWGDTIETRDYDQAIADGTLTVSTDTYPNKRAVRLAELALIIQLRPLYNWRGNELNPDQVPKWVQVKDRAARDEANGIPAHRTWAALYGDRPVTVTWWRRAFVWWRSLRRRDRRRLAAAALWATLVVTFGAGLYAASDLSFWVSLYAGFGVISLAGLWLNQPSRRRVWARATNDAAQLVLAATTIAAVVHDLFPFL